MRHPHATAPPSSGLALTNVLLQRRLLAGKRKATGADSTIQAGVMMTFGSTSSTALPAGAGAMPIQGTLARRAA